MTNTSKMIVLGLLGVGPLADELLDAVSEQERQRHVASNTRVGMPPAATAVEIHNRFGIIHSHECVTGRAVEDRRGKIGGTAFLSGGVLNP